MNRHKTTTYLGHPDRDTLCINCAFDMFLLRIKTHFISALIRVSTSDTMRTYTIYLLDLCTLHIPRQNRIQ